MKKFSPEVDAYIAKSPDFARPILERLRKLFHQACPEIEEEIKWGCPHFVYKGIVGSMAAFKHHCGFGFWKLKLLKDPHHLFNDDCKASMSASKVRDVSELPADKILLSYIVEAVALNENEVKVPKPKKKAQKELKVPDDVAAALKKNKKAREAFDEFSPSHRREYLEWIIEAKQEVTRQKRLATAIEWMSEGKPRNWKYMRK